MTATNIDGNEPASSRRPASAVAVLVSYGSRWGPGKTHYAFEAAPGYFVAWCTEQPIHAQLERNRPYSDVDCKSCLRKRPS